MNADISNAQATTWAKPTDKQLEAFFRDRNNFQSGMRITSIIYAVGRYDSYDDWDRGVWVYDWNRQTIRVRVITQAAYVKSIEVLDCMLRGRFDEAIEELWLSPDLSWGSQSAPRKRA